MAKSPRHSTNAPAVTIELGPQDVTPIADAAEEMQMQPEEIASGAENSVPPPRESAAPADAVLHTAAPRRVSGLLSGLIGGLAALLGGAALQWAGVLPSFQSNSEIAVLRQEIATLAEKPAATSVDPAALESLSNAQAEMKKSVESLLADFSSARDGQKQLSQDLAALASQSAVASGDPAALNGLAARLSALETGLASVKTADSLPQIADMQAQIAALKQNTGNAAGASNVARAIAAAGLKAAIDRGGDFASELETYATVAPGSAEVEQLKSLASRGVPSKTELTSAFDDAATAMLSATKTVDPDAGFVDRLINSAESLVKSRPVGALEGDTPEALVARMELAVKKGDLDLALEEANKLPDAAKAAGAGYISNVAARRDTDALVTKALTAALSAAGAAK